jgi:hypothetical protein
MHGPSDGKAFISSCLQEPHHPALLPRVKRCGGNMAIGMPLPLMFGKGGFEGPSVPSRWPVFSWLSEENGIGFPFGLGWMIILDELFSGLSMAEVASMLPIIEKLMSENLTIIMIEHRLRELFRISNRVMVLNYGKKIAEGLPKEVMESEEVKKAYLGSETE